MSKERLEEAKLMAEMLRVETRLPHDFPFDLVDWLVEQSERVQELEEDLTKYRNGLEFQLLINNSIKKQNKRYREALELLVKQETLGKDVKTGKTAVSYNGMIALKGLNAFDVDNYIVYGVDEIIESVLEEELE